MDLSVDDIDVFINGVSGDVNNDRIILAVISQLFNHLPEVRFKHLCGEYCTASSFGLWLGASILKKQQIPPSVQFNHALPPFPIKNVLLVNQYMGRNYSFMVLNRKEQ
jgi:hypothetical protein